MDQGLKHGEKMTKKLIMWLSKIKVGEIEYTYTFAYEPSIIVKNYAFGFHNYAKFFIWTLKVWQKLNMPSNNSIG